MLPRTTYLDPAEESCDSDGVVELGLPVGQRVELGILARVLQERIENLTDSDHSVNVEYDANVGNQDDNNVQDVPDFFEVAELVDSDLWIARGELVRREG